MQLRQRQKTQGLGGAPYHAVIESSSSASERAKVSYHGGSRTLRVNYPYVGRYAWIRAMPEPGSQVLLAERFDSREPEILTYYQRFPENRSDLYDSGVDLYRPLFPGEIDIASIGLAQTFLGRRPVNASRGGLVRSWLDQDKVEAGAKAATHRRVLHLNTQGAVEDEERLGVAWRYQSGSVRRISHIESDRQASQNAANQAAGYTAGPFAREYMRRLGSGADFPDRLINVQEGDVLDDTGVVVNGTESGLPLRSLRNYYTETGESLQTEIDNRGNFCVKVPTTAEIGGMFKMPNGPLQLNVGSDINILTQQNFMVTATENVDFTPSSLFNIGAARDENAVLGQQLKTFLTQLVTILKTGIYVGNLGSPVTMSPATLGQLESLVAQYISSDTLLSDFIFLSKAP